MPISTDNLLQRVRGIMPDLKVDSLERDEEGLINDVMIVNQEWVFRFAKSVEYARLLQIEMKVLDLIRPRLDVKVPDPIYRSTDCMVYPLLNGIPLTKILISGLSEDVQNKIAAQLGKFLDQLHTMDLSGVDWEIPFTRAPVRPQRWLEIQARVKEHLYPLFQRYQREWAEALFGSVLDDPASSLYQAALIHGDMASYHILFDEAERKISAVIDFGMAGLGDPASDFGGLISIYGESFVRKMQDTYPNLENYLPRARFYAQLLELEWVLLGLETGETFWFTAHLGGARDIM